MSNVLDRLACYLDNHPYLPVKKRVQHYSGDVREVVYLRCPRCGVEYCFPFHEYWHRLSDMDLYNKALQREKTQGEKNG